MNECFFIGNIITDIEFNFLYNSKHISIAKFEVYIGENQKITVKAYDEIADYVYSKLEKHNIVFLYGRINTKVEVILEYIKIIGK